MRRLIDAVYFLGKQELSFRSHDESESSQNKGNYVELLKLLQQYDEVLRRHLSDATVFTLTVSSQRLNFEHFIILANMLISSLTKS